MNSTGIAAEREFRRDGLWPGLAARIEGVLVRHRRQVTHVHLAMFVLFAVLMVGPLLLPQPTARSGIFDNLTWFARFAVWGVWFPLVFVSVVFAGRSWCGLLCPMGAASEWANRIGPRWSIPRWVQWPGTPIVSFVLVTIWAQTVGARDHALAMAIVFGSTLAAALLLGFFFGRGKRAWCRHVCPIGLLLGVYSRIGALDFRPKRPGGDRWTERTACPTMIDLDRKTESRHCIACYRCVSPPARGGLYLRLRPPGAELTAIRDHHPNLPEVLFLFMGTGAALGGFLWLVLDSYQSLRLMLGNWAISHGWYWAGEPGPVWLMAVYPAQREVFRWLDFLLISAFMLAWTAAMTIIMGGATAAAAWLAGRLGSDRGFAERFVELGYQFLPVVMVSLLLSLGSELFAIAAGEFGHPAITVVKAALFALAALWTLRLGERLLARDGVPARRRWLAMIPGLLGTVAIGAAWYPAVFFT